MRVARPLSCHATGTRPSRKIRRRCHTDVACRLIVGDDIPDVRTMAYYYQRSKNVRSSRNVR